MIDITLCAAADCGNTACWRRADRHPVTDRQSYADLSEDCSTWEPLPELTDDDA